MKSIIKLILKEAGTEGLAVKKLKKEAVAKIIASASGDLDKSQAKEMFETTLEKLVSKGKVTMEDESVARWTKKRKSDNDDSDDEAAPAPVVVVATAPAAIASCLC